mmetsp:Transcript_7814/g.20438  ORF Transcript_7814/g.20438 Transcript_7814/m.20438 type:complete len:316 (+) Transcript_7814:1293-2240(+)
MNTKSIPPRIAVRTSTFRGFFLSRTSTISPEISAPSNTKNRSVADSKNTCAALFLDEKRLLISFPPGVVGTGRPPCVPRGENARADCGTPPPCIAGLSFPGLVSTIGASAGRAFFPFPFPRGMSGGAPAAPAGIPGGPGGRISRIECCCCSCSSSPGCFAMIFMNPILDLRTSVIAEPGRATAEPVPPGRASPAAVGEMPGGEMALDVDAAVGVGGAKLKFPPSDPLTESRAKRCLLRPFAAAFCTDLEKEPSAVDAAATAATSAAGASVSDIMGREVGGEVVLSRGGSSNSTWERWASELRGEPRRRGSGMRAG